MSGKDIRNIMNLMETAMAPVVEAPEPVDEKLKQITDAFLAAMKEVLDREGSSPMNSGSIGDDIYNYFAHRDEEYEYLAKNTPMGKRGEDQWMSKEFKARYGMGMLAYGEKVDDAADAEDEKSIKPDDAKIYKLLSYKLTVKATPKWAAETLKWYKSGQKIVVIEYDGSNLPLAVFGKPSFEELGMDQAAFGQWLLDHGIQQMKRPVQKRRPSYSVYD